MIVNVLTFDYNKDSDDYSIYSGPPDVAELQDHLGYLSRHGKVWKFETPEQQLPLAEWELRDILDKLVELNDGAAMSDETIRALRVDSKE